LVSEGIALRPCGSVIYAFLSCYVFNLRGFITGGVYFI
jgi:hypothetical protein